MQETQDFDYKSYIHSVKNRLKNNNYSKYKQTKVKSKFKLFSGMFSNLEVEVRKICNNEEELYNKVVDILNSDCISPLAQLTDMQVYSKLNEEEKQRYMLNLSEKYNQIKNRINSENSQVI